jgi:hypothetical protein
MTADVMAWAARDLLTWMREHGWRADSIVVGDVTITGIVDVKAGGKKGPPTPAEHEQNIMRQFGGEAFAELAALERGAASSPSDEAVVVMPEAFIKG